MAYNNQGPRINSDKNGNPYQLKTAVQIVTKDGEAIEAYKAFVELGGKLYKLEISPRQKELTGKNEGKSAMWVKVTLMKKQHNQPKSM